MIMSFLILIASTHAQTYYVSNSGSDSNSGLTASAPIKTISKVNSLALRPGDQVLFNRGDRWDFLYDASITDKSGSSSGNITYGAYGNGAKPIFTRSMHANKISDWNNQGGNIWSTAFTINDDVGLIIFNDETGWGKKQSSLTSLKTQGDFYYNPSNDKTYIYSASNPASHYNNIELSKKGNIFDINRGQYIVIKDLDLRYSAKDAVFIINSNHIYLMNLSTHFIGGAYQSGTLRYGNALEVLGDSSQIYFLDNTIFQTYDAGISPQIGYFTDIYMKHNTIIKARYCYEYFNHNPDEITNRVVFDHNTCYDSGGGFGGTSSGKGVRTGAMDGYISQFNVTNNIFYGGTTYLVEMQSKFDSTNSYLNNNLYYTGNNAGFNWRGTTYTYTNFATYQTTSKQDKNSKKADPLFTDPSKGDFRPKQGSPACTMSSSGGYVGAVPCGGGSVPIAPPVITANTPPTQNNPTLKASDAPYNTTNAVLSCNNQATFDADGDTVTNRFRWYKNSALMQGLTANTVSASNIAAGERWICEVTPYDGKNYGVPKNSTALTINPLPDTTAVVFSSSTPDNYSTNDLTCYATSTGAIDTMTVDYTVYNGTKAYSTGTKTVAKNTLSAITTVKSTAIAPNQVWTCSVKSSYDGKINESAWNSQSITIKAVPAATNPTPTTTTNTQTSTDTTGLKGSWDLTTNYLDKINGNKALNYGATYFMSDSIYQSVLRLSDSKSYLKIAYADGSLTPKDGFTVDVKVKFNSARHSYIVSDKESYMLQRVLIDKTTTRFQAGVYSGNTWNPILNSNTNLQTNKWYRVTYTYDKASGVFKLYLDKKLNAQKTWSGKVDVSSTSEVFVGNREQLDRWLDGSICNLKIYDKALSATEILNLQ